MNLLFKTKLGLVGVAAFALLMAVIFHRVRTREKTRGATGTPMTSAKAVSAPATPPAAAVLQSAESPSRPAAAAERSTPEARSWTGVAENAAYLEPYYGLDRHARQDHDALGNSLTRRENAKTPDTTVSAPVDEPTPPTLLSARSTLRLSGNRPTSGVSRSDSVPAASPPTGQAPANAAAAGRRQADSAIVAPPIANVPHARPKRFNPYGNVIKCELVFALDSSNEGAPLVGLVMEPVYNNGLLVIPAGAELHGIARPDWTRDRVFSAQDWVLVFPREQARPNGRQLNIKGVALDRVEPDANGMTWGITDGSYGLEGKVIRSSDGEEIKRFAATFLAEAAVTLQSKQSDRLGQQTEKNTPQNAVLQGISADLQQVATDIAAEVAKHGVFIRVPAGHQFYFYPQQIIDADVADISSDIATVK